jgi:hypothetical protein
VFQEGVYRSKKMGIIKKFIFQLRQKTQGSTLGLMFGVSEGNNIRNVLKISDSKLCNYITKSRVSIRS